MTAVSHSPLPWRVGDLDDIEDADGQVVADLYRCVRPAIGRVVRNAAYVVTACNAYERVLAERDELLSALRGLVAMYGPSTEYEFHAAAAWRVAESAIGKIVATASR